MTKEELLSLESYEIKLNPAGQNTNAEGKLEHFCTCNIQIFDMEKKVTLKAVSGVLAKGESQDEAADLALEKACQLLGAK